MVSQKQIQREKLFKANKRKDKRKKRKQHEIEVHVARENGITENKPVQSDDEEIQELLASNNLGPDLEAAFKRFYSLDQDQQDSSDQDQPDQPPSNQEDANMSKKKLKKLVRPTVFELKQMIRRPEVVELVDTTAKDPHFLVYLKAYKNTAPVPKHWAQKRKFLQNKRGTEKMPFSLPDFIEATGISKIRAQMREREAGKLLKQRMRERMNPKLGKLDIDYQVLHDAFFKNQRKPKMTIIGDIYHEGKENELKMRVYRPGQLSDELKRALGLPDGCPPPWLINMQRFGPPPSYPSLKIPGITAPQEGNDFSKWGKSDSDILSGNKNRYASEEDYKNSHWGEIVLEEEEEEIEEEEEDTSTFIKHTSYAGFTDLTPLMGDTRAAITSSSANYEIPANLEIRKKPAQPIAL